MTRNRPMTKGQTMTPLRLTVTILSLATLAACGGRGDVTVRNGPQAVHPSPSALAQGTAVAQSAPAPVVQTYTYTPVAGDGSQPIID